MATVPLVSHIVGHHTATEAGVCAQGKRVFSAFYSSLAGDSWWKHGALGLVIFGLTCSQTSAAFANCDVESYYKGLEDLQGTSLSLKLHDIVQTNKYISYADVWDALKLLDSANDEDPDSSEYIVEIYSQKEAPKNLAAKLEGWNREHLWPRSYGLKQGQPEFTDLHNLRPADTNVNSSRGNKVFGDCALQSIGDCLLPANREAASDTATDRKTWRPPAVVRGDIARALMYMAIRYSPSLKLSDTPAPANSEMGLLSILLRWNELDPPSASEQLRNNRVCELYQHNRNPFVDHPELANEIWGKQATEQA